MKVLAPAVTIILASHMKPYLRDALDSVLAQTRKDFECVVVDSGQWIGRDDERSRAMAAIHADYAGHPLIEWVTTGERAGGPGKCPIGWVTNQTIRAGLVRGRYVCTFYDDDLYRPEFIERMAGFLDETGARAVWCSQDRVWLTEGSEAVTGAIHATGPKGPGQFDNQVDGAQIMFRRDVLDEMGDPWLTEDPTEGVCRHSDGIFLERLASIVGIVPNIADTLLAHRHTPLSTYSPSH